jgi:hypothetical protein
MTFFFSGGGVGSGGCDAHTGIQATEVHDVNFTPASLFQRFILNQDYV